MDHLLTARAGERGPLWGLLLPEKESTIDEVFPMRTLLYDLLKRGVSLCFNTLNVLLGGNLPPFGSAAVIVEEQDCYLVVELPRGRVVFPGGFMTWREDPKHTAQREAQEETGLLVRVDHLIGTYFSASDSFLNMSTVSCVYAAEVIGGVLRNSVEGRACWLHEEELRKRLSPHSRGILDDYLRSRPLQRGIPASSDSQMPLPLAS